MSKKFNPGDRVKIKKNAEPDFDRGKKGTVIRDAAPRVIGARLYVVQLDSEDEDVPAIMWAHELKALS